MEKIEKFYKYLMKEMDRQLQRDFLIVEDINFLCNDYRTFKNLVLENEYVNDESKRVIQNQKYNYFELEKIYKRKVLGLKLKTYIPIYTIWARQKLRRFSDDFTRNILKNFKKDLLTIRDLINDY